MSGLCIASSFLAVFIGSILFNQSQAETHTDPATITNTPSRMIPGISPTKQLTTPNPDIAVTIEMQATATLDPTSFTSGTNVPTLTVTPGLLPLGTLSYPLTVTADSQMASTRVAAYRNSVAGTRTAIANESSAIYQTLTAAAPAGN